jgi:hypothetical protein
MTFDDLIIQVTSAAGPAAMALIAMWYKMGRMEEKIDMLPCSPQSYSRVSRCEIQPSK